MRLHEILNEATELGSTVRAITTDIGSPILDMYGRLRHVVQNAADSNGLDDKGNIRGLGLIVGGETGRWVNSAYVGKLENELFDLVRYAPKHTAELTQFLANPDKTTFKSLSTSLPTILKQVAKALNEKSLYNNAVAWEKAAEDFRNFISKVTAEADRYGETGYDDVTTKPAKTNPHGQQNANVESIINDVLGRIDRGAAGDIRNVLAKSPNKLATLQQELARRGINL
jgi:hypothetical protein